MFSKYDHALIITVITLCILILIYSHPRFLGDLACGKHTFLVLCCAQTSVFFLVLVVACDLAAFFSRVFDQKPESNSKQSQSSQKKDLADDCCRQ